jgi:hypothetical protein
MKTIFILLALILISRSLYSQQVEDWIYFKDSTMVKGLVTEIKEGGIEVETAEGLQKYRLNNVARIVKKNPELMVKKYESQTAKGSMKISWQFSYSHLSYKAPYDSYMYSANYSHDIDYSYSVLQLSPSLMYFFADNLGAGIILNAEGFAAGDADMEFNTSIGVNLQYYFSSGYVRPYLCAQALYLIDNENGYSYAGGAGLSLYLGKNIALQPLIQYGRTSFDGIHSKEMFIYSAGLAFFIF